MTISAPFITRPVTTTLLTFAIVMAVTNPDVSATQLRRARLGVEGVVYYDVKYILEVDFANDAVAVKDAYLQYQGVKIGDTPVFFRAGNFRTPNSFELLTSELFVDTVERAAFVNAWQLARPIGFQVSYWTDHWGLAAGIFGDRFNSANNPQPLFPGFTGDEDVTFSARATVAPINRQVNGVNQVLFFGASVRTRDIGDDQPLLQYTQKGADFNLANNTINTGRIGKEDTFWGLEAATLWGPFSLQGEYSHLDVDLPHPLKHRSELGRLYAEAEDRLQGAICVRFGLPGNDSILDHIMRPLADITETGATFRADEVKARAETLKANREVLNTPIAERTALSMENLRRSAVGRTVGDKLDTV